MVGAQRRKQVAWQRLIRYQQTAAPIVESVLEGYNGTIFCYGQTGAGTTCIAMPVRACVRACVCCCVRVSMRLHAAGKTFTMDGEDDSLPSDTSKRGLMPNTFQHIFDSIKQGCNSLATVPYSAQRASNAPATRRQPRNDAETTPRLVRRAAVSDSNKQFLLRVSYLEIYNEEVIDLCSAARCVAPCVQHATHYAATVAPD